MEQRRSTVLGRGLDTLLPVQGARVIHAALSSIRPGRHQARLGMNVARLEEFGQLDTAAWNIAAARRHRRAR